MSSGVEPYLVVAVIGAGILLVALALTIGRLLTIAGPDEALVVTGIRRGVRGGRRGYRIVIGGRLLRFPFVERLDRLPLVAVRVELASVPARSWGCVPLTVEGAARVRVARTEPGIQNAVECLLDLSREEVRTAAQETVTAVLRTVLATLKLEEAASDTERLAEVICEEADAALRPLGLEVEAVEIQAVTANVSPADREDRIPVSTGTALASPQREPEPASKPEPEREPAPAPLVEPLPSPTAGPAEAAPQPAPSWDDLLDALRAGRIDESEVVRQVRAGGRARIDSCVAALDDFGLRPELRSVLLALGAAAVPSLVERLSEPSLTYEIKEILVGLGDEANDALLAAIPDLADSGRLEAVLDVLTRTKPRQGREVVLPLLGSGNFAVRIKAEEVLRTMGVPASEIDPL